jgi:hypothetical protein
MDIVVTCIKKALSASESGATSAAGQQGLVTQVV